jgi:hypothetical protein
MSMESNQKKRKVYPRKHYPLIIPADPNVPITQSPDPQPVGPWLPGVEFVRMVKGQPVTFVLREDGSEGPLTDFFVMNDPRKEERPPKRSRFVDDE